MTMGGFVTPSDHCTVSCDPYEEVFETDRTQRCSKLALALAKSRINKNYFIFEAGKAKCDKGLCVCSGAY